MDQSCLIFSPGLRNNKSWSIFFFFWFCICIPACCRECVSLGTIRDVMCNYTSLGCFGIFKKGFAAGNSIFQAGLVFFNVDETEAQGKC